jgi:hypothetical protein
MSAWDWSGLACVIVFALVVSALILIHYEAKE